MQYQYSRRSEATSLFVLVALILAVFISVVAWRVNVDPSITAASPDLALRGLSLESMPVPTAVALRSCETTASVSGDLVGEANPKSIRGALCSGR